MKSKGKGKGRKQSPGNEAAVQNPHKPNNTSLPQCEHTVQTSGSHEREVLPGVRRVWGTMRSCSVGSVAKAIRQLTNISIWVKQKYKTQESYLNGGTLFEQKRVCYKNLMENGKKSSCRPHGNLSLVTNNLRSSY